MSSTVTVSMGTLVNRALLDLVSPGEQGMRVVVGSDALADTSDDELTLTSATGVNVSDMIELDDELVLVTGKTDAATPVLTVSRGYYMTTAAAHAAGTVGYVNPPFPRRKIQEAIRRSFARMEALGVPLVKSATFNRESDEAHIQLTTDVREVLEVLYKGTDGRFLNLGQWEFHDTIPTAKASTGKILNIGRYVADADDIEVLYRAPYRWSTYPSDPDGDATIEIPEGAEDLPALYAAAWMVDSREISRSELDRAEEWGRTEMLERGSTGALVRARWQAFYRALDEARRLNRVPRPIEYKPMPRF